MGASTASTFDPLSPFEQLRFGREILRGESQALSSLADQLGDEFCQAADLLFRCRGSAIVCGMGKAGLIGRKLAATLASTGTRSHFLHPAEAIHGDLGRIHGDDVLLLLSQSGQTEEVVRLLPTLAEFGVSIVAITGNVNSPLARAADVVLGLGKIIEACPHGLAPTTSTTAMIGLGDALALVVSRMKNFGPRDFARFHPGGSLGQKLARVEDAMRPLAECRLAHQSHSVRSVFVEASRPGRRTGAIMLVGDAGELTGIFTDSDLAKLFERRSDALLDLSVSQVMTARPTTVVVGSPLNDAVELLGRRKFSELPVVDAAGKPAGLIDITDVIGLLPPPEQAEELSHRHDEAASHDGIEEPAPRTLPFPGGA